ncbi:MAG: DUF2189 domain-containing protein [Paracoccaceae bacterium]
MPADGVKLDTASNPVSIRVRRLSARDFRYALRAGLADFLARPTHSVWLMIHYPLTGLGLTWISFGYDILPLAAIMTTGFALVGPVALLGLLALSRAREIAPQESALRALGRIGMDKVLGVLVVALILAVLYALWLALGAAVFLDDLGATTAASPSAAIQGGWARAILVVGAGAGLGFVAMAIGAFSVPLIVDGETRVGRAICASVVTVLYNAAPMTAWGCVVVALLLLGSLPLFVGLVVMLPVLGHATWHLYRRTFEPVS